MEEVSVHVSPLLNSWVVQCLAFSIYITRHEFNFFILLEYKDLFFYSDITMLNKTTKKIMKKKH